MGQDVPWRILEERVGPPARAHFPGHRVSDSVLIGLAAALLYGLTRSLWLDEWDSVQFAQGVQHFDLFQHRPHPPGYPLFIFFGWAGWRLLGLTIPAALTVQSCLWGGVFVAAWHSILRRCLDRRRAALAAAGLAFMPMIWMTAVKALTDIPSAGAMALELALVLCARRRGKPWIVAAALAGAAAAGFRPQNTLVALIIVLLPLRGLRRKGLALACFMAGCLLWVVPTLWTQSRLERANGNWLAWPGQLASQWRWRLDKPGVYLGAGDLSIRYLASRANQHLRKSCLERGMGFEEKTLTGLAGWAVFGAGWGLYLARRLFRRRRHRIFWRLTLPWAVPYFIMIFGCLPADVRYYCPVAPLLVLPALAGCWSLGARRDRVAWALPGLFLVTTLPLALHGHNEPPPPVRLIEAVKARHPREDWGRLWLVLRDSERHGAWYAPECRVMNESRIKSYPDEALAVYTDDHDFVKFAGWPQVRLDNLGSFSRPATIYKKHDQVTLFQVLRR